MAGSPVADESDESERSSEEDELASPSEDDELDFPESEDVIAVDTPARQVARAALEAQEEEIMSSSRRPAQAGEQK